MSIVRIALANVPPPRTAEDAVEVVLEAMQTAADGNATFVCFPECFVPGYRLGGNSLAINEAWLEQAWARIDARAAALGVGVILGTERVQDGDLLITARVTDPDGTFIGFQDKVQLDPSEEATYTPGTQRRLFEYAGLVFGIVICHEGWRYPETVRWAARGGAHVVFHPHFELVEDPGFRPQQFADPANTFHEKAALCRAAENNIYFATNNCALDGATTTSAIVDPDGALVAYQPHGNNGVLFGDIDTALATGFLAGRLKPEALA